MFMPVLLLATLTDIRSRSLAASLPAMPRPPLLRYAAPLQTPWLLGHSQDSTLKKAQRPWWSSQGAAAVLMVRLQEVPLVSQACCD